MLKKWMCAWVALFAVSSGSVSAAGLGRLNEFMTATQTARGNFEQKIYDRNGKQTQVSSGSMAFARPGKFRWTYVKPYAQLIVGDGTRVWVHDEDLNQVTVRKLDQALGSTPAALLAGNNEVMKAFALKEEGAKDGLEWVEATPKEKESNFERIRMGFGPAGLEAMDLIDSFGQTTQLRFTQLERNPKIDPTQFRFTPPKGADIVGEQ